MMAAVVAAPRGLMAERSTPVRLPPVVVTSVETPPRMNVWRAMSGS